MTSPERHSRDHGARRPCRDHGARRPCPDHRARRLCRAALPVLLFLVPATTQAQGWIEPRPGRPPVQGGVEKLRTSVSVRIADRVAHVEVEEWFRNNGAGMAEGDYAYPLPGEAVFASYSLYQGDRELRGEVMDAAAARGIYEGIVRAQRDPALIELIGRGMLRARVFPIEAGQTRRITLRYTQVLDRAGDALEFRYAAGARHAVMRADAWHAMMPPGTRHVTPPPGARPPVPLTRPPVPLTFSLVVDDATRFREPFSPTHALRTTREGSRMSVRPRDDLTGDFAVFLPFAGAAVGLTLAAHRPAGEDGYFMLSLSPGAAAASRIPRDVTMVVDVSGSMSGEKMEQARRALHQLAGTLGAGDRLRMIAFSSVVTPWRDGWVRATPEQLRAARDWIDELRANGGTNIHGALEEALRVESPESRLPVVVFMTDGMPTVGETRAESIAGMVESVRGRTRIFVVGIGYDVNTQLLDRLSEAARGTTQYVRPEEDVEQAVSLLAARIRHPVLTDLALGRSSIAITDVYPRQLPDLFAGEDLVLFGRYRGSGEAAMEISGRRNGVAERFSTRSQFPARAGGNGYIAQLWAARKVGDLDRRIRSAQADGATRAQLDELVEELRAVALRHGLLSEYTAYLVTEPGIIAGGGGRHSAPVAMAVGGETAVRRAEEARRARAVSSVAEMDAVQALATARVIHPTGSESAAGERVVAGRRFVQRGGTWEDARHGPDLAVVTVEPYSEAYFAVLRALPELVQVLRELDPVTVAGRRSSVRVASGGMTALDAAAVRRLVQEFRER
jgi:Ca-activated chloride channel homolog